MTNIIQHNFYTNKGSRNKKNGHNSFLIIFTGFSGSGKSTLANALEVYLTKKDIKTYCLDGDNVRSGINKNLSFSPEDRSENLRRIGEVSKLFVDAGILTIASFVAPYQKDRENIKNIVGEENYIEIHVSTDINVCEKRDIKGLYAKVRRGEIKNLTGIDAPYEVPSNPDMRIDTDGKSIQDLVEKIYKKIIHKIDL